MTTSKGFKNKLNFEVNHIVAVDKCYGIGKGGNIPWHNSFDMEWFRLVTTGNSVIMGRKTFENIHRKLDGPLPDRMNCVLTKKDYYSSDKENLSFCSSIYDAFRKIKYQKMFSNSVYIAGGESVYNHTKNYALVDNIYMSMFSENFNCDKFYYPVDMWSGDKLGEARMKRAYQSNLFLEREDLKILKWEKAI